MMRPGAATRLVAGRAVSNCGDWLTTVAVAVALYTLTRSLAAPALAILFRVAPRPLGTLAGGHLADRFGAVPTLVALNLSRAGVTGALAMALRADAIPVVLTLLAVTQAAGGAAQPAGQAAIPRLVPAAGVARLNAAVGAVDSAALIVGPGIAGGILGLLGAGSAAWLVAADAVTFLLLAALLASLPRPGRATTAEQEEGPAGLWSGIGLVLRRPFLRQLALAQLGIFATITCLQAVLPAAAQQRFGSAAAAGWVYAAIGAGNVIGAVALLRTRHRGLRPRTMALLTLGELIPLGAFALVGSAWIDMGLAGLSGLASAPYEILAMTEVARIVSSHRLGQASGAIWLFGYAGMLAGGLLAAAAAPRLGWVPTLLLAWIGGGAVLVAGWLQPRRPHRPTLAVLLGRSRSGRQPESNGVRTGGSARGRVEGWNT
jgi:MFS family permease